MATFSAIYSIINKNNLINLKIDGRCLICRLKNNQFCQNNITLGQNKYSQRTK